MCILTETVEEKLKLLPDSPGVYLMKNEQGRIIYVGKAVVLKNRVRQYFQSGKNHTPKVRAMVSHIADFETIMTGSEVEALILECNLIKKHRPHYNISLKDDKSYPYVKVTVQEDFPRVLITRRLMKDGARYFGPYTNATAVKDSLKLLRRLFPLRTCKHLQDRPCLEYHIMRCLAPCVGKVSAEDYQVMIRAVLLFLEGRTEEVEKELNFRMEAAAENYNFELAARLRDQLLAVQKVAEKQNIITGAGDQDALGMARSELGVCVQVFFIRSITGRFNRSDMLLGDLAVMTFPSRKGKVLIPSEDMMKNAVVSKTVLTLMGYPKRLEDGIETTDGKVLKDYVPGHMISHNGGLDPGYSGGPALVVYDGKAYAVGVISTFDKDSQHCIYSVPASEIKNILAL